MPISDAGPLGWSSSSWFCRALHRRDAYPMARVTYPSTVRPAISGATDNGVSLTAFACSTNERHQYSITALALTLPLWLAIATVPTILFDLQSHPELAIPYQIAAFVTAVSMLSVLGRREFILSLHEFIYCPRFITLTIGLAAAITTGFMLAEIGSAWYAMVTFLALVALRTLWRVGAKVAARGSLYAGLAMYVFLLYVFATQEIDLVWRRVGDMHPNLIGGIATSAAILCCLGSRRLKWPALGASLTIAVLISSRNALVALALFAVVLTLIELHGFRSRIYILFAVGCVLIVAMATFGSGLWKTISAVLYLDDPYRGLSSGLSGRVEYWNRFLPQVLERPFTGYGFRQRDSYDGTHNAVLNLILESGIVGGGFILFFLCHRLTRALCAAFVTPTSGLVDRRAACVVASGLCALAARAIAEPQILNVGDVPGITLLFLLMFPSSSGVPPGGGARQWPVAQAGGSHL